ncbi:FUSC family protein [Streptomyces avermitilis]|uniref:FUSC family protein n=1 Tax=Streptomyces avermitilis TaxID=33903 RepID=UPI003F4CC199
MLTSPAPVVDLVRRSREPVVVRTLRSTAAAVLAYLAGPWLSGDAQPLLAPVTAVLVVQVTLYATLTLGIRRIAGVLIAVGFADTVGLTWWSLGLLVLICLWLGDLLHLGWEVCCVRCGPADCGGGGAVAWIRAGAGRSAAPDDEEHIASWEEQCGTGY